MWEKLQERITRTVNEMPRARRAVFQVATQLALTAGYKAMETKYAILSPDSAILYSY